MKVAVIGSRGLSVEDFSPYLPPDTTELVSGGAKGIDQCVARYAQAHQIQYSDLVTAFWDGRSKGTQYTMNYCEKTGTPLQVVRL